MLEVVEVHLVLVTSGGQQVALLGTLRAVGEDGGVDGEGLDELGLAAYGGHQLQPRHPVHLDRAVVAAEEQQPRLAPRHPQHLGG